MKTPLPEVNASRRVNADLAKFPETCPVCGSIITERGPIGQPWEVVTYGCGGGYKPMPQCQTHTNVWRGYCGKETL